MEELEEAQVVELEEELELAVVVVLEHLLELELRAESGISLDRTTTIHQPVPAIEERAEQRPILMGSEVSSLQLFFLHRTKSPGKLRGFFLVPATSLGRFGSSGERKQAPASWLRSTVAICYFPFGRNATILSGFVASRGPPIRSMQYGIAGITASRHSQIAFG